MYLKLKVAQYRYKKSGNGIIRLGGAELRIKARSNGDYFWDVLSRVVGATS